MSIYEGLNRARHETALKDANWNYFVLGFAGAFEAVTVRAAIGDFTKAEGRKAFWDAIRTTKDPSVITVLLDNAAASVGLVFAFIGIFLGRALNMPYLDGLASLLIGLTFAGVAVVLAIEIKGLLIGEGMSKEEIQRIRQLAEREQTVVRVGAPLTMYFGPQSMLLALDVEFDRQLSAADVTAAVDRLEKSTRSEYPNIQRTFIEAESLGKSRQTG
jgi:divalent metal cation (Fe/Co/Zn/Cd) transporter